jgi:Adenylate kinase
MISAKKMHTNSPSHKNQGHLPTRYSAKNRCTSYMSSVTYLLYERKGINGAGGPGTGKGTQCEKLVKEWDFVHLSSGDLLRAERDREGSQHGAAIKRFIQKGELVPTEITIELLQNAIQEHIKKDRRKFLIDGFPRKMDQVLAFESNVLTRTNFVSPDGRFVRVRLCCTLKVQRMLW